MSGIVNLQEILNNLVPILNEGQYVFVSDLKSRISNENIIGFFREKEGNTFILELEYSKKMKFKFDSIFSWITINVHSSLQAVGLTAAMSDALSQHNISCNVVAGYYHDHIFVLKKDTDLAMKVLRNLSKNINSDP